jgi:imidazolonepropionase-like amidohydrolase
MKSIFTSLFCFIVFSVFGQKSILLNNVEIFDGKNEKTFRANILIEGNLITKISSNPIETKPVKELLIIDAKGKFLMPGLIDAHAHTMMDAIPQQVALLSDISYISLYAGNSSEKQLMRGFTTVRDVGGSAFSLKKAIDEGFLKGPRIFPSGATISQTGGHGDFGMPTDVPRQVGAPLSYMEKVGMTAVADGDDLVLMRTREQLRQGASQIKLMAGGGVASNYDPLDVTQFTFEEFKAAVDVAKNWGTYVTIHAYTPDAIRMGVEAGVKCVEHGQLIDEPTAQLLAEKGVWLCLQPFLDDEDAIPFLIGSNNRKKQLQMVAGTDNAYKLAKKYKVKVAFGTDTLFDPKLAGRQGFQLAKLQNWYTPYEILKMATSTNAELLEMSGLRNPYQDGKLGVVQEGAYADLILVEGNPLKDINLITDPENNFSLIIKNGMVYKNSLSQ